MALWDRIKDWFASSSEQYVVARLPDPEPNVQLVADEAYFNVWLAHGFLDKDREWFTQRYPAVHVSALLNVAGSATTVTRLAQPSTGNLGPGVWIEYPVTGLTPYRGGTVEIEAGLSALERSSYFGAAISVLADFSALVAPPLSTAITVAGKVTDGVQKLLDEGGDEILLGLHATLTAPGSGSTNELAPGHLAVVKATEDELPATSLSVQDSRLYVSDGGNTKPLEGYSYLLFRIEARRERDDWRFAHFDELIGKAIDAHFTGDFAAFQAYRSAVTAEIFKSPDLTKPDRRRISRAVVEELDELPGLGLGAVGQPARTLAQIVERQATPVDDPVATSEISLEELLNGSGAQPA